MDHYCHRLSLFFRWGFLVFYSLSLALCRLEIGAFPSSRFRGDRESCGSPIRFDSILGKWEFIKADRLVNSPYEHEHEHSAVSIGDDTINKKRKKE